MPGILSTDAIGGVNPIECAIAYGELGQQGQ